MKPLTFKVCALTLGVSLWYVFSQQRLDTITLRVPVYFYNQEEYSLIDAPDTVQITLYAQRLELTQLDMKQLAIHIDASRLKSKKTRIALESHHLFLPNTIKLVHYDPAPMLINMSSEKK